MRADNLPTWDEIRTQATDSLEASRSAVTDAANWLRSDWKPDSPVPTTVGDARTEAFELITQIKELTDRAKDALNRTRDDT